FGSSGFHEPNTNLKWDDHPSLKQVTTLFILKNLFELTLEEVFHARWRFSLSSIIPAKYQSAAAITYQHLP
ncbi:hypothetical protein C5Y96_00955, partial [Blastopirellula marina]